MSTIIKTLAQYKAKLGGVQKEMYEKTWMPYVEQAEPKYIMPFIGQALYDELVALTTPDEKQAKLINLLQAASAQYAYMSSIISMTVSKGDAGIMQNNPANSSALTKWQFVTLVKDSRDKADSAMETALKWLTENKADFSTWTSSDEYKESQSLLISSAKDYTKVLPFVNDSLLMYKRLKGYIGLSERDFIAPAIGHAFLNSIKVKAALANPQWTEVEEEMLDLLRSALGHHAFSESIMYLNINSDFRVVSETDGVINEGDLSDDRKSGMIAKNQSKAIEFLNKLKSHLNLNASATVYPLFFSSKLYKPTLKPLDKLPPMVPGQPLFL